MIVVRIVCYSISLRLCCSYGQRIVNDSTSSNLLKRNRILFE